MGSRRHAEQRARRRLLVSSMTMLQKHVVCGQYRATVYEATIARACWLRDMRLHHGKRQRRGLLVLCVSVLRPPLSVGNH